MELPKVEGTQIRGKVYHLNLRIKPEIQDLYGGKSHLRGSLRTSDPKVARREVRRYKAELLEKEQERARQAEVEDLIAQLTPEQRRAYDAAGGLEGLLEGFGRAHPEAEGAQGPGTGAAGQASARPPATAAETAAETEGAVDDGSDAERVDDDWPIGGSLTVISHDSDDYEEEVFTLADLFEEYAAKFDPAETEAMRQCVRLFTEFHREIAYDELTVAHLDDFIVAAHGLPADMMARLADGTYVRDLPFAEMVAWTVATDAKPISETTRFQFAAMLKQLMAFGVPRYRRGDPWSDYRMQVLHRDTQDVPAPKPPSRFAPSEWTLSGATMRALETLIAVLVVFVLFLLWQARH